MGSLNPQLTLDFKPTFIPKTITQFLQQISRIGSVTDKILKLDDFVSRLETEMRKIDAFKRELPLCMFLINDAIFVLKEESMLLKKSSNAKPVLEEFIPLKNSCEEDSQLELIGKEKCSGDKKNWLSSTQLWNTNTNQTLNQKPNSIDQKTKKKPEEEDVNDPSRNHGRNFIPNRDELPNPGLSLITPGIKNPVSQLVPFSASNIRMAEPRPNQQTSRKQRRCWSTELHRRFVNALQQLGGSQAATPKQIRELMQVDGLTNDEVKSHLQKYRLHSRRYPSGNRLNGGLWMSPHDQYDEPLKHGNISQSGSPDGPLLIGTIGGTSTTGDNSMDDGEDEKSENYCWKTHLHTDDI